MDAKAKGRTAQRRRRTHKNVSTGCDNCKIRHMKCDEGKPSCQRCKRANISCAGYHPPKAWIFDAAYCQHGSKNLATTDDGSFGHPHTRQTDLGHPSPTAPIAENPDPTSKLSVRNFEATLNLDNLGTFWKQTLLDIFLTTWVPDIRMEMNNGQQSSLQFTSMALWPRTAWKLAMQNQDDLVVDAILSLTLHLISTKTKSVNLAQEALRIYNRVLAGFQERLLPLTSGECSTEQESSLACLATTGICCAQFEFVSESLFGYNRHLVGTGSILHSVWPSCLAQDDTRRISLDHRFLRTACAMVRRQGIIHSASSCQEGDWNSADPSAKRMHEILVLGEQITQLLEQYDVLSRAHVPGRMLYNFQKLKKIVENVERLMEKVSVWNAASNFSNIDVSSPVVSQDYRQNLRGQVILSGYAAAFAAQAVICMWNMTEWARKNSDVEFTAIHTSQNQLTEQCGRLANEVCRSVDFLVAHQNGMMIANPSLFFVDTAWLAYKTLAQQPVDLDLGMVRQWFSKTSCNMRSLGFQPLRECWHID